MQNEGLISVIIPVYQVEQYLEQCLDSVVQQTYQNLDIILVDDGSIDRSGQICDQYALKDSRIRVIHKENGGLVSARKAGLKAARGNYIGYVDSDDWVDRSMFERLYSKLSKEGADIVVCAHTEEYCGKTEIVRNYIHAGVYRGESLRDDFFPFMLYEASISRWGVSPACWDKLLKKELIYDLQMDVDERIWDGEDHAFIYPAMLNAECICVIDDALYYHRIRNDSVATGYDPKCFERFNYLLNGLKEKFEKSPYWDVVKETFPYEMRWFLLKHIYSELGVPCVDERCYFPSYLFPFNEIDKGAKVVIYGAGAVGQLYYKQIIHSGYCDIVAWVDRNYKKLPFAHLLMAPEQLREIEEVDCVVVAVEKETLANSIKADLSKLGIDDSIVLWKNPRMENWKIC